MKAEYKNVKIHINKMLFKDQKEVFELAPLTAKDPAFFTSEIHIINHVSTPEKLGKFTDMLVDQVIYMSPETCKLKAAIAMKKAEIANYAQKFVLPNAKLTVEYGSQFDRNLPYEMAGFKQMMEIQGSPLYNTLGRYDMLDRNSGRVMIAAQWKPIEGGTKIAEIARCKAELNELNMYLDQVNTELEMNVRSVVNRAIAKYFIIEKSYKNEYNECNVIIVDECQFLHPDQVDQLSQVVMDYNIPVLCFGLSTDFLTHLFPGSKRLFEIADSITEIKSVCKCGDKATVNARLDDNGNVVFKGDQLCIGGNERYVAMCKKVSHIKR